MAELLLGLAKSAVEGTLTTANLAIEEEEKLQKSVKCDLMLISDEFEMMHSFLNVAKDHITNDMSRTLVRQVRNMALDVEDCIESVVHLDNKSNWWRRLLPSCLPAAAPVVALNDAVANMEMLKARVGAMGQRNKRYSHMGDSSSKSSEQMHKHSLANATALDILVEARDSSKEKSQLDLLKLISMEHGTLQLQVISVWGTTSNVGMTSVIKEAYNNPEICNNFKRRAWVKVMHPFSPYEFIQSLILQFYSNSCQQYGSNVDLFEPLDVIEVTKGELIEEFKKQVNNHRYLLVLEDMSVMNEWDTIKAYLPDNKNGSCIIVHTEKVEIASLCIGESYGVTELKKFSDDHSVCVFFKEDRHKYVRKIKEKSASAWLHRFKHVRVGREIDLSVLRVKIHAAERDVIFVWGIAGVGKSYIVRHVYCSEVARKDNTFECFGWVNVTHPFNIRDLSRSLLLDLRFESLQHGSMLRIKDPIQECRDLLHEQRCLVVIDGLRSVQEWELIKSTLALGPTESSHRSCIVVITDEESVTTHCAAATSWNVKGLEADESLDLFRNKVSVKTGSSNLSTEVINQAKLILDKCGGIPEIIVAIADFLSSQLNENGEVDLEGWWMMNHSFIQELTSNRAFGTLQSLFSWVHFYFFTCPDFLKPCIFYLSIFPINQKIRRRRLVRRWIAEGYCRDNKQNTAEETAEEFFSKLVDLCMIRMLGSAILASSFRMSLCQINGFFREYIISRPMEENQVFTLEGSCSINSQHTGRHLAIGSSWDRDRNLFDSMDFSKLRSLTVFGQWKPFFISDEMRLLRVLDLEDASEVKDEDIEKLVRLLPRLKFLSLSGCTSISRLPNSVGNLRQLQTLNIRGTSVVRLPKSIIKLNKLQFLRAGTIGTVEILSAPPAENLSLSTPSPSSTHSTPFSWFSKFCIRSRHNSRVGVMVPHGIGRLTTLGSLGFIDINVARCKSILRELKNLTLLRKLGVSGVNCNNSHEFFSAISSHRHLEFLSVKLGKDSEGCMDCISRPPENLKSLKLFGLESKLPVWIMLLQNLTTLHLKMTMIQQEEIDLLDNLPKLAILCLSFQKFENGELRFRKGFRLVHILEITCSSRLEAVRFAAQGFSSLVALKLDCCNVSHFQVFGLSYLKNLKEVWLSGSYEEALKGHLSGELAKHPNEIKPVLREGPHYRWYC